MVDGRGQGTGVGGRVKRRACYATGLQMLINTKPSRVSTGFWFCLSLTCAGMIGLISLQAAFAQAFTVQDDARQHVFWIQRLIDPELFPNDLIADYFQSVAPVGYTTVYWLAAKLGIEPLVFSKLLPVLLGLIAAAYCFGVALQILPVPFAGFLASLLMSQNLMMADDLYSATPRAFLYPLFLAFLYYLARRSLLPCLATIALQGLFYPQGMFISCGVLVFSLVRWDRGLPRLSRERKAYLFCGLGLVAGAIVLLPFVLQGSSEFVPVLTATQAKQMPEFGYSGRNSFFSDSPWTYWLFSERSGMLARPERVFLPPPMLVGLALPFLLRYPARFPLVRQVTAAINVLQWTLLSSLVLFGVAHLVLFKLHLPNRYTQHSLRMVLAIAAAVSLTILLDALFKRVQRRQATPQRTLVNQGIAWGLMGLVTLTLVMYPAIAHLKTSYPFLRAFGNPLPGYVTGRTPEIYRFFAQQPKDTLIAATLLEANNLPTFTHRSVLVAREYAIPYHWGYYSQFQARVNDQIQAQYSTDPEQVRQFIQKYGIDFWIVDAQTFTPRYLRRSWLQQYQPAATEAANLLEAGKTPVLQQAVERCALMEENGAIVLEAACVIRQEF